ncbi:MAG: hypothetical protein KHW59_02825 [Clostridiales bacterium]|nr:hypothetical protein [Clostridiales bacterium]
MKTIDQVIRPGLFGDFGPSADRRRVEFDIKNSAVVCSETPVDLVLAGDSIVHFWDENIYFRDRGVVLNRGIEGDQAHVLVRRFQADVIQLRPRVCVLLIGINNTWAILDGPNCTDGFYDEQLICGWVLHLKMCYQRMLHMLQAAGIQAVLCSLLPMGDPVPTYLARSRAAARANTMLRELAKEEGCAFADFFDAMTGEDKETLREGLSWDGIHPHWAGYTIMTEILNPILDALL